MSVFNPNPWIPGAYVIGNYLNNVYGSGRGITGSNSGLPSVVSLPNKMKIVGGNYKAPSYSQKVKKASVAKRKLATVASVKKMIYGMMEKKQKSVCPSATNMTANGIYTYNLTAQVTQGTTDGSRIGDSIELKRYIANIRYTTNSKAAFFQMRILVFWSGEEFNPSATFLTTGGLGGSQIFIAGAAGWTTAIINTKDVTVLHDQLIEINSVLDTFEDGVTSRINIPLSGKFPYQEAGSVYGKVKNLYLVIIPDWVSTNATTPANAGNVNANGALYYTDA